MDQKQSDNVAECRWKLRKQSTRGIERIPKIADSEPQEITFLAAESW